MAKVAVIIPHWKGYGLLKSCLDSLMQTKFDDYEIIIVDNGCVDGSISEAEGFPKTRIVSSDVNLGYAGGCNYGVQRSVSEFIVLLNNDTEVDPDWLDQLMQVIETAPSVGAVQPKILNYFSRDQFDYSGAAGGELDVFGYPFTSGRLYESIEADRGQYTAVRPIFWASGAASIFRRSAFESCGGLEEDFFAHMEEIDLCWRMHWAGWTILFCPDAVVYHQDGGTLKSRSFRKMLLNHRNSLLMIMRNLPFVHLLWIFPLRLVLECITVLFSLLTGRFSRACAVPAGIISALFMPGTVLRGRRQRKSGKQIAVSAMIAQLYPGSSAIEYFCGRKTATDLLFFDRMKRGLP